MHSPFPPRIIFSNILTPNRQEYSSNKPLQTHPPPRKIRPQAHPSRHPRACTPSAATPAHTHPDRADYPSRARRRTPPGCVPGSSTSSSAPSPAPSQRPAAARLASPFAFAALSGLASAPGRGLDEQRLDRVGRVVELVPAASGSGRLPSGAMSVLPMRRTGISHVLSRG